MVTGKKAGRPKSFDREAALARALDLFLEKNYPDTSLSELLVRMDIARQSFYDTFESKEALFLEAFQRYEAEAMQAYRQVLGVPGSPMGQLEKVVRGWGEQAKERPFGGCLINAAAVDLGRHHPQIAGLVRLHFHQLTLLLRDGLQKALARGELAQSADPTALARLLVVHCQGLIVMGHAGVDEQIVDDVTESLLQLLPRL